MKKKFLLVMITMLIFVMSCGNKSNSASSANKTANSATFNMEAEPTSLDPQLLTDMGGFIITGMTYESLVRLNDKNEVVPAGAESWTTSEDGKVWTFNIRKGMKWSNGDDLTAHDYVRGMLRGLNPDTAAEYAFMLYYIEGAEDYNTGKTTDTSKIGIKATDDYTLEITLTKPAAYFDKTLILPIFFPLNEKAITENGDAYATEVDKSVYSGPYVMKEWIHDNKVVLERNPNYWNNDNTKLDSLTALMVADFDAATNLFENKELELTKISVEKIENYKDKPELQKVANGRVYYLGFNAEHPVLKNIKVRQALALALNRDDLVSQVLNGAGIKATGLVANGFAGSNGQDFREQSGDLFADYAGLDPKALFEEGLKELGMTADQVKLTLAIDDKGTSKKEGEFYQAQWKEKLGIDVNVEIMTYKERIARGKKGDFEIIRYAWGPDYADAMTYLEIFTSPSAMNISKWKNAAFDNLMLDGQVNQDEVARVKAMQDGEKLWINDFYYSPLYYEVAMYIKNPSLEGVVLRSVGNPIDFYTAVKK